MNNKTRISLTVLLSLTLAYLLLLSAFMARSNILLGMTLSFFIAGLSCYLGNNEKFQNYSPWAFKFAAIFLVFVLGALTVVNSTIHSFYFGGLDLAWYAQAVWKIANALDPIVTIVIPMHHLSNHFEFIVYPLGWLYAAMQQPIPSYLFLLLIQLLFVLITIAAFVESLIKHSKSNFQKAVLSSVFFVFVHWGFIGAVQFEFHPPSLGLCFFLISLLQLISGRLKVAC